MNVDGSVVDLMMPGLSGPDTVRLARRTRPALKALFVSGYADRSRFKGELGDDVVLKKPFELETLVAAVQTALHPKPANVVPLRREQYSSTSAATRCKGGSSRRHYALRCRERLSWSPTLPMGIVN
jgi:DNA-binding response OmpR family regulator